MTTVELMDKIIDEVLGSHDPGRERREIREEVFRVLEESNSWFCRLSVDLDADGLPGETQESKYEDPRQPGLFR